jgi:hypothetical protein
MTFCVSPPLLRMDNPTEGLHAYRSVRERRLRSEWALLQTLVALNPNRLSGPLWQDTVFLVSLLGTPAVPLDAKDRNLCVTEHRLRIVFPVDFPALPMEAYLANSVFHPNIHPETGFLCLWEKHASTNTVEHALHKTAAMLGWSLLARNAQHCMQAEARKVAMDPDRLAEIRSQLQAEPLSGVNHREGYVYDAPLSPRRRRLSSLV